MNNGFFSTATAQPVFVFPQSVLSCDEDGQQLAPVAHADLGKHYADQERSERAGGMSSFSAVVEQRDRESRRCE